MILVDVNLLLYAYHEQTPEHHAAKQWLETTLMGEEAVGLPWPVILGFLRLTTDPRSSRSPITAEFAAGIVESWLDAGAILALPGAGHWEILNRLMRTGQCRGPMVSDAHLAALAIEQGALLCSHDRDFARFPGLRWFDPLEESLRQP